MTAISNELLTWNFQSRNYYDGK